jgi:predicted metal-dependent TIM-barrel fold hydrolase
MYGHERLWMNSACDWGHSIPLNVPYTAMEMRRRGHTAAFVDQIIYQNPIEFMRQSPNFSLPA